MGREQGRGSGALHVPSRAMYGGLESQCTYRLGRERLVFTRGVKNMNQIENPRLPDDIYRLITAAAYMLLAVLHDVPI